MSQRNRNGGNNQRTAPQQPAAQTPPVTETKEDTVVQAHGQTEEKPTDETANSEETNEQASQDSQETSNEDAETAADPVETETVDADTTTTADNEDDQAVATLKELLAEYVEANKAFGTEPKDFAQSAKLTAQIMRHVVRYPRNPVLTALLDFFKEHKDGAASANFMKGSTTLDKPTEQRVGFLYNLFAQLASGQPMRIEVSRVIQVLGKSEFVNFYNRRANALKRSQ